MNKIKIIILGTMSGIFLGFISLGIAYIAALLLVGSEKIPTILIVSTLVNGAILGVVGIGLGYISSGLEHRGIMVLISLAVASLTVLLGNYGNGSILPIAIYLLAITNGGLISKATTSIARSRKPDKSLYLQN